VRQILLRDFSAYKSALAEWTFTNADFKDAPVEDGDFVYADPPYDVEFTQYARGGFSWADQERTAIWLSRHPGPVVLVNQATGRIERLYRELGFRVGFLDAPRRIGCTGDRSPAREIIGTLNVVRMANSGQL
jgi:DNA adenine methylase